VIEDFALQYPNSALLGITVDAAQFGTSIPLVEVESLGIQSPVPSNWNPLTRAYAGVWDGTFKNAWHDSPAWFVYALATSARYGIGAFLPVGLTDKWRLYAIAQYCDALVPDGAGGQEPRYRLSGYFDKADDPIRVLAQICSIFRGMPFWGPMSTGGCGLSFFADIPAPPARIITPQNTVDGKITYAGAGLKALTTAFLVSWYNPANSFKREVLPVEADPSVIARYGWRQKAVVAIGAPSRGQVWRAGQWLLEESMNGEVATWVSSWDQADLVPGEMTAAQDRAYNGVEFSGRLAAIAFDGNGAAIGITVDRPLTFAAAKVYGMLVMLPDGTCADAAVTNAPGTTQAITFAAALAQVPVLGAIWALTSGDVNPRPFRILNRKENDRHLFAYTAKFVDVTAPARIEQNIMLEAPRYTALPTGPLAAPSNVTVHEGIVLAGGGVVRSDATVSWTQSPDPRAVEYEVQIQPQTTNPPPDFTDVPGAFVSAVSLDVFDQPAGPYLFRVRALDSLGITSAWATSGAIALKGLSQPPADVANLRVTYIADILRLAWDEIVDLRPFKYEIRQGAAPNTAIIIASVAHPSQCPALGPGDYWVAAYVGPDSGPRIYSPDWAHITVGATLLVSNVIATWDEAALGWPGTFTNGAGKDLPFARGGGTADLAANPDISVTPDLESAGGIAATSFYYAPLSHVIDVGRVVACNVGVTFKATGVPVGQDITTIDWAAAADLLGSIAATLIDVVPIIRTANGPPGDVFTDPDRFADEDAFAFGLGWTPWTPWTPGAPSARYFQMGLKFVTASPTVIPYALLFSWFVDPPDRTDDYQLVPAIGGTAIVFTPTGASSPVPFNGGPGGPSGQPLPQSTWSITGGPAGATVRITGLTLAGCTVFTVDASGAPLVLPAGASAHLTFRGY